MNKFRISLSPEDTKNLILDSKDPRERAYPDFKEYELSSDKKGLLKYYVYKNEIQNFFYHVHSDELTNEEKIIHDKLLINNDNNKPELNYHRYGFECPNINSLKTKEEKDVIYNKILGEFKEQLKTWIYEH